MQKTIAASKHLHRISLYRMLWLHVVMFLVAITPLLTTTIPPLSDYPAHLAHAYILHHYNDHSVLQEHYTVHYDIVPHSAMDVLVPLFMHFTDVFTAGKIFLVLSLFLIIIGALSIQYALHRAITPLTFLIYPFLYNICFTWGFATYLFSSGLMLSTFAFWIYSQNWPNMRRITITMLAAILIFFSHVISVGILGLLLFLYEQCKKISLRERFFVCIQLGIVFLPIFVLWLMVPPPTLDTSQTGEYLFLLPFLTILDSGYLWKGATSANSSTYRGTFDLLSILTFFIFLVIGYRTNFLHLNRRFAIALGILAYLALLIPHYVLGVYFMNVRIPWIICILVLCMSTLQPTKIAHSTKATYLFKALCIILIFIMVGRHIAIQHSFYTRGHAIDEVRSAFLKIKGGSTLLSQLGEGSAFQWSLGTLAIIEKHALVPQIMTGVSFVNLSQKNKHLDAAYLYIPPDIFLKSELESEKWPFMKNWRNEIDYFLLYIINPEDIPPELRILHQGSFFTLYCNTVTHACPKT